MTLRAVAVVALLLLLLAGTGCEPQPTYQRTYPIAAAKWAFADSLAFAFPVSDTAARYDLVLELEHAEDFRFQNFYVRVATHLPDGGVVVQSVSLELADKFGEWFGECSGGSCATEIGLQEGSRFTDIGDHRLVVSQYSREEPLAGVESVGFRLVKVP